MARKTKDKLRILTKVIQGLVIKWAHFDSPDDIKVGDLVVWITTSETDFSVGFVAEIGDSIIVREIGSDRSIKLSGAMVNLSGLLGENDLLDGDKRRFFEKLMLALAHNEEDGYLFDRLEFNGDQVTVWIKQPRAFQVILKRKTKPFSIQVPLIFDPYAIRRYLNLGGYGSREFEPEDAK